MKGVFFRHSFKGTEKGVFLKEKGVLFFGSLRVCDKNGGEKRLKPASASGVGEKPRWVKAANNLWQHEKSYSRSTNKNKGL